ncbi:AI-2E family transporter, partial [Treponema sp. OttesenSCG-928-L16]|nr:AI-2E family transporter [Treponema sp. OttesenSCG-928-L16]
LQFWPEPAPIIMVGLIMLAANMIIGNVLEPKIMGDNLGLSPIVVLVSLMIWGWIWGFAGMILAVPMTVVIKILCENVPFLEPLSILLGSYKATLAKAQELDNSVKNDEAPPGEGPGDGRDAPGHDSDDDRKTPPPGGLVDMGRE